MSYRTHQALVLAATLLIAPLADAHPLAWHSAAWQAFVHPFTGFDHLLAMLVVGAWAALTTRTRRLLPPLGFIGGLAGGAALGAMGVALPALEAMLAVSVLLLGPLAAREARLSALLCVTVCALAGLIHGYAHGSELSGLGGAGASFVLGSLLLHGAGYALATRLAHGGHGQALRAALSVSGVLGLAFTALA